MFDRIVRCLLGSVLLSTACRPFACQNLDDKGTWIAILAACRFHGCEVRRNDDLLYHELVQVNESDVGIDYEIEKVGRLF